MFQRFARSLATAGPAVLHVTGGLHRDAKISLEGVVQSIGSAPDDAIILLDDGIAPHHASLRRDGAGVEIEAVGGEVMLADGTAVAPGFAGRFTLPVTFVMGGAELCLRGEAPSSRPARWIVAALLAAAVLAGIGNAMSWIASDERSPPSSTTVGAREAETARDSTRAVAQPDRLAMALAALQSRLAATGLTSLDLRSEAGRLIVTGAVTPKQAAQWEELDHWFDATYAGDPPLAAAVTNAAPEKPAIALKAVWTGARPFVVTADDVMHFQGDALPGGWTISAIEPGRLLLARSGETVTLTY
jgi:hypothetical protein